MQPFNFKIAQMLEYQHVFRGTPKTTEEYIQRIGKEKVLMMSSFFVNTDLMELQKDPITFIHNYFTAENQAFADRFIEVIWAQFGENLQTNPMAAVNFINQIALYHIIDKALTIADSAEPNFEVSSADQIEYLKMLLAENTKIVERQAAINNSNMTAIADAIRQMMACQIADWDYSHVRLEEAAMSQMFKCVYFFQFAEQNLPVHLQQFCEQNGLDDWKQYARSIIGLFLPFDERKGATIVVPDGIPDYQQVVGILDKLSTRHNTEEDDYDFLQLRDCPLYKKTDRNYMILSKLFLVEKLYKSLYFEFKAINDALPRPVKKSDFKSYVGLNFAEEYLCNKILAKSFPSRTFKKSGVEYRAEGYTDSELDYYVRNGNKAFLFECKDALFKSTEKVSYDATRVEDELRKKMYYAVNERGVKKPKALLQLLNNAQRLIDEDRIDREVNKQHVRIYPIIITHDRAFTAPGVNWTLNQWYIQEVHDNYPDLANRLQPLVMIDIDTLILTCSRLQSRRFRLEHWIEVYNRQMLANELELNQLPFTKFVSGALLAPGNDMDYVVRDLKVLVNESE